MTRPSITIREAQPEDVPALLEIGEEVRELGARIDRAMPCSDETCIRSILGRVAADPCSRALVAVVDDQVAGLAVLTEQPYAPFSDQRAVHANYLHVRRAFRRHGVGKALLAAAVSFADEVGAEHLFTSVPPQQRDTHRFYARLGFGPVVVRRSVPVPVLRRRLASAAAPGVVDGLVARRRSMRKVRAAVARAAD